MVAEGRGEQLMHPATDALDLDAVIEAEQQDGDGHAERDREIGSRHDAQIHVFWIMAGGGARRLPDARQEVDGDQVHQVHHHDPDEGDERQRSDELARLGVAHDAARLLIDELDQEFHCRLHPPRLAAGHVLGHAPQHITGNDAEQHREKNRVDVDDAKVDHPGARTAGPLREVVDDVFACRDGVLFCSHDRSV
ncbi:hypothetical protein GALL_498440 [mine drainage metagenome]|uniref:Uncharacterized protein n=1 Tax=mine drainage metagenome TaxID=410659 RepID=A0A1J5PBI8_9ZZZZ